MRLQARLLLFASVAAALVITSTVVGVAAGSHQATMPLRGSSVEDDDVGLAELEEEAAYPRRRVLAYSPQYIGYGGLTENKAACYGSCPAQGQPYTRGCKAIYGCRGR
uniref:Uncharacterized protein n=1 Tax=Avena sativa TaxID=4498 RepID=A0ACD5ZL33_AVESA